MANENEIVSMKEFDEQSTKPVKNGQSIVEEVGLPEDRMFYGGKPPLRGARRPKGYTKIDSLGHEVENPFEQKNKKDISSMPEFEEAFGPEMASAIARSMETDQKKFDNTKVTIIHGEAKPLEATARVDPHSIAPSV